MQRLVRAFVVLSLLLAMVGCASSAMRGMADSLAKSIANQNDPITVRDGAPAYLLLIDGFILDMPEDEGLLLAGAQLYGSYAGIFVDDVERAKRMSEKARSYAQRALCQEYIDICRSDLSSYEQFIAVIDQFDKNRVALVYSYATAWAGWVQAHSRDFAAVADLPKIEALLDWVVGVDAGFEKGQAQFYLGVLRTLRPPALGGDPEVGRAHFERAIEFSAGRDLLVKVEFARRYARLMFDQELHDRLLQEVVAADPVELGLTLSNTLAQVQAHELLDSSTDYFEE